MTGRELDARAWGWVAALRTGATTPWREWADAAVVGAEPSARVLPGAQQLELLRRLNLAGRPDADLVERVLGATLPGRGPLDLDLVDPVRPTGAGARFGPRPVDPQEIADDELIRVAVGLLAEDLRAAGPTPADPARRHRLSRRRAYRLVGAPWPADRLREQLGARGHPPGGRRPLVLVLGGDLATMTTWAWTARAFAEGGAPWSRWLAGQVEHDRVPPRADLAAMAHRWVGQVGRDRVRVVLDLSRVPALLRDRAPLRGVTLPSADATDLARRLAPVLGVMVAPERRSELLRGRLLPRLLDLPGPPGPALAVPESALAWVQDAATRLRDDVVGAGYPVVGDPDRLVPDAPPPGRAPRSERVLELAVGLLLGDDRPGPAEEGEQA